MSRLSKCPSVSFVWPALWKKTGVVIFLKCHKQIGVLIVFTTLSLQHLGLLPLPQHVFCLSTMSDKVHMVWYTVKNNESSSLNNDDPHVIHTADCHLIWYYWKMNVMDEWWTTLRKLVIHVKMITRDSFIKVSHFHSGFLGLPGVFDRFPWSYERTNIISLQFNSLGNW